MATKIQKRARKHFRQEDLLAMNMSLQQEVAGQRPRKGAGLSLKRGRGLNFDMRDAPDNMDFYLEN